MRDLRGGPGGEAWPPGGGWGRGGGTLGPSHRKVLGLLADCLKSTGERYTSGGKKKSTNEGLGPVGRQEGIAVYAVALVTQAG